MRFEFTPTFGEQYLASFAVLRRSLIQLIAGALFPLMGLVILVTIVALERRVPTAYEFLIITLTLAFTPLITAFTVWMYRRKNRLVQGAHRITFEDEGVRVAAPAFDTLLRYSAIRKVAETKRFLLLFFSAYGAQYVPKRVIPPEQLSTLRQLLRERVIA